MASILTAMRTRGRACTVPARFTTSWASPCRPEGLIQGRCPPTTTLDHGGGKTARLSADRLRLRCGTSLPLHCIDAWRLNVEKVRSRSPLRDLPNKRNFIVWNRQIAQIILARCYPIGINAPHDHSGRYQDPPLPRGALPHPRCVRRLV